MYNTYFAEEINEYMWTDSLVEVNEYMWAQLFYYVFLIIIAHMI